MNLRLLAAAVVLPLSVVACPGPDGGENPPTEATMVVGVQSEDLGGVAGPVHIVAKLDGIVVRDETVQVAPSGQPAGAPSNPQQLPREIEIKGKPDARVDVAVDAFAPGTTSTVIARTAVARLVPDATKKLLRVVLDSRCAVLPGAPPITTCGANETCSSGRCIPSEIGAEQLEDYAPDWAAAPPDICRPAKKGAPEVIVGTGQTDYSGLADGQTLQLEKGPQGGHHIWVAVRMKNLRQSGSMTTLSARIDGDPAAGPVPSASYVFTFDRDEGAYCKLWGLRYQVDVGAADLRAEYKRFLGKRLAVTVEVLDSTGAKASGTKIVQLADKLLCPDGTDKCNE